MIRDPSAMPPASAAAAAVPPMTAGCFSLSAAEPIVSPTPLTTPVIGLPFRRELAGRFELAGFLELVVGLLELAVLLVRWVVRRVPPRDEVARRRVPAALRRRVVVA